MKRQISKFGIVTLLLLSVLPALAWNATGHKVVARIAWESMQPQTRERVVALLMAAPKDAGLLDLIPDDSMQVWERQREFLLNASNWADIIRDLNAPERREKYHHSPWHYINFFWEQPNLQAAPIDRPDMKPEAENIVERLYHFQSTLADTSLAENLRAVDLAWVLHLVGDIHQPLHCSARVTPTEPEGDRGGNLFKLDSTSYNLHSYWDNIVSSTYARKTDETEQAYIGRLSRAIMTRYTHAALVARLKVGDFEGWAKEGYETSKTKLYPASLQREQAPSESYHQEAYRLAEAAIALAGYRLAEMLNRLFGS